jgi:glycosyltransferase involved in cell wall biosynthesis
MGRFVARMVEALADQVPVRLVTNMQIWEARISKISTALLRGYEIRIEPGELPRADDDIQGWVRRLLRQPRARHQNDVAGRSTGIYTWLRPPRRHFRRELNILYDFTPPVLPWTHTDDTKKDFGDFCAWRLALGDKAIAISEATRFDAGWLSTMPVEDVVVGYPGPSLCVHEHAHPGQVRRSRRMILVVSTLEPRKNGRFLMEWFLNTAALPPDMELWWVGPQGWLCDWSSGVRRRGRTDRQIRLLGMVSDRRLCELYRQASFSIYPSLYEGFGFPVLDSLRHGTPVLCSYNSSLQEFGGEGVFYFDACDPASLDAAAKELLAAQPLVVGRDDLDERFSWSALARTVLDLARN